MAPLRPVDDKVGERLEADADVRRVFEDFRALPLFLANTRARKHRTIFADEPRWRRYVTRRGRAGQAVSALLFENIFYCLFAFEHKSEA